MLHGAERRFPLAKSSKSKDDEKKQKSADESRSEDGQLRVMRNSLKSDLILTPNATKGLLKETTKGVLAANKSSSPSKDGSISIRTSDGKIATGALSVRSSDGAVVYSKTSDKEVKSDVMALLGSLKNTKIGLDRMIQESLVVYKKGQSFKGMSETEVKAGLERLEKYHAATKTLFHAFLNDRGDTVFSGALAGNTKKNKVKKKSDAAKDGELKKAR